MSVFQKVFSYCKDYGKPKDGQVINLTGILVALFIIVGLTVLAFRFGVWYLSLLLVGEYKENYECLKAYNKRGI